MNRRTQPRGFTLIELMIAIGVIVIVVAMAVPAYRFILGNRSQDAAENLIAAMLARARGQAINSQRHVGVAFFVNPNNGRTTMALVIEKLPGGDANEDPYLNYKGYNTQFALPAPGGPVLYQAGQEVIAVYRRGREMCVGRFYAKRSGQLRPPPDPADWGEAEKLFYMDFQYDGDFQALPEGVGCQLINDPSDGVQDRYVQTGAIIFDKQGRLVTVPIMIGRDGGLGRLLKLTADLPQSANYIRLHSQLGVVLYDASEFRGQMGTRADSSIAVPGYTGSDESGREPAAGQAVNNAQETAEEQWLDQNALQLMVGRYNGNVLRGK